MTSLRRSTRAITRRSPALRHLPCTPDKHKSYPASSMSRERGRPGCMRALEEAKRRASPVAATGLCPLSQPHSSYLRPLVCAVMELQNSRTLRTKGPLKGPAEQVMGVSSSTACAQDRSVVGSVVFERPKKTKNRRKEDDKVTMFSSDRAPEPFLDSSVLERKRADFATAQGKRS